MKGGRRVNRERWVEISFAARQVRTERAEKRAAEMLPVIESIKATGATSLRHIATALNAQGITTPRGGQWRAVQVKRALWAARWFRVAEEQREWARQRAQQV
jgi:Recombinase